MHLRRIFLAGLAAILLQGCFSQPNPMPEPDPQPDQPSKPLRYLALGDSYTIGEAVAESDRWPVQLADSLREKGIAIDPPQIIARTGWTTGELRTGISNTNPQGPFDLVSLLIGVNNQYRGFSLTQYETEFAQLLSQAIAFAGGDKSRVFVVSIPDYGQTPFGQGRDPERIARELDAFNAAAQGICLTQGVDFFNITPISREGLAKPELVAADGLHPSGIMYRRWVESFFEKVRQKAE